MTNKTSPSFSAGDKVQWNTSQGMTHGTVVRKVTHEDHVEGHVAHATRAEPQYEVRSDKSGKTAIHKPESLKKAVGHGRG